MGNKFFTSIIVAVLILSGWFFYSDRSGQDNVYEKTMMKDTYGGDNPEATIDLFVTSLREGDIELASKYFMLDENLSRDRWFRTLEKFRDNSLLEGLADDIEDNPDLVNLELNTYSGVWKITDFK